MLLSMVDFNLAGQSDRAKRLSGAGSERKNFALHPAVSPAAGVVHRAATSLAPKQGFA
jgi:hypothetical protein